MLEKEIQARFFEIISNPCNELQNGLNTYRELVRYRFEELLDGSLPKSKEIIGNSLWQELITAFIIKKPAMPLIWKAVEEFRLFAIKKKFGLSKLVKDMLWYECARISCYQAPDLCNESSSFNFIDFYRLSNSARIKTLEYSVHNDCENIKNYLLVYRNYADYDIYFIEITQFMYMFLKLINSHKPQDAIDTICKK
ncbi:MAG: hypothetical protein RL154_89, partial [Pseudomonadota bacterium]